MFVGTIKLKVKSGKLSEAAQLWHGEVARVMRDHVQLKSALLLADDENCELVSLGFWSSLESCEQFMASSTGEEFKRAMANLLTAMPERSISRVAGVHSLSGVEPS